MAKILITGATGFIGRRLVDNLRQDPDIAVLALARDVSRITTIWPDGSVTGRAGDLSRPESIVGACEHANTVIHLAGYAHAVDVPRDLAKLNHHRITVEGTRAILSDAVASGVQRFIFVSSVKAMGEGGTRQFDETDLPAPTTDYGRAKFEAEREVLAAGERSGMHVVILRLPLVYGAGNKGNIPRMIAAIDQHRFPPLPRVENRRSMIHIDDVIHAIQLVLKDQRANGKTFIVTDGAARSSREIYLAICRALGRKSSWAVPASTLRACAWIGDVIEQMFGLELPLNSVVLDKLLGSAWYSDSRIRRELGYVSRHTLESALPEMIDEYRVSRRPT